MTNASPEWGRPDWTLRWQTQPANEYHQGEVEIITIQPAQETLSSGTADVNVTTDGKKQAKCEMHSPSIALGCQTFVNETNTLAQNSLASLNPP